MNQADIDGSVIENYLDEATAVVQSYVAKVYDLPTMLADANFTGSQAESFLKRVEVLFAAGSLLNQEYGYQDSDQQEAGDAKINKALDMLRSLSEKTIILLDVNGAEFSASNAPSSLQPYGFPLSSTAETSDGHDQTRRFNDDDTY